VPSGGGVISLGGITSTGPNIVTFSNGRAQGPMTGLGYVELGLQDTITSPLCAEDPNNPTVTRPITAPDLNECETAGKTCPTTGQTVWNSTSALCISGTTPKITTPAGATSPDYKSDWGLQIGVNTSDPPADTSGNGHTLGTNYSTVALTINPSAVTPANPAIRAFVHLVSQACTDDPYCFTVPALPPSGVPVPMNLTDFNTECWAGYRCGTDPNCIQLKATDIPNIDKVGVQISSDIGNLYTVNNFCLQQIAFGK
jgi:hypothetical protein